MTLQVSVHKNTAAASRSPSTLFSLPRELRDLIYDYVLTSRSGLTARADRATGRIVEFYDASAGADAPKFNQLQYVSHQLRKETRGLAMKNNVLSKAWKAQLRALS